MDASYVGVIGTAEPDEDALTAAEEVGRLLAARSAVLVCGGLTGVMEAACRGAASGGGTTVGLLPSLDRGAANPYVGVALTTGMGEMRNALIARCCDALIAVGGGFGTLSEIGFALKIGKPVVGIHTWELARAGEPIDAIHSASDPAAAVELALQLGSVAPRR